MKTLKESLFDDDIVTKDVYIYHPKTKDKLIDCIEDQLKIQGPNANLNVIDVSKITDMCNLFGVFQNKVANIDISEWDVGNVKDMSYMFDWCTKFNCDLSKWDVRKVLSMDRMFWMCTKFNYDLSKWNVKDTTITDNMFFGCDSLKKYPSWYENS